MRRVRAWGVLGAALLVLLSAVSGCATMPDNGPVSQVPSTAGNNPQNAQNAQVRVYAVPPKDGEQPRQLLLDFLDAVTSDESDYRTAREYLTDHAAQDWRYDQGIAVLDSAPTLVPTYQGDHAQIDVTGQQVAGVDRQSAYTPAGASGTGTPFHATFDFVKDRRSGGQWRIDHLPPGLILQQIDFQRIYQSVNLYFPSLNTGIDGDPSSPVLVPDPVFLRSRTDPVTEAARALLQGPTSWFQEITKSQLPADTTLLDQQLAPDDSGTVHAHLGGRGGAELTQPAGRQSCQLMAAQMLATLQDASSGAVKAVALASGANGSDVCRMDSGGAAPYAQDRVTGDPAPEYFLGESGQVMEVAAPSVQATPVRVPQVPSSVDGGPGAIAVSRAAAGEAPQVAVVSKGSRELYVENVGASSVGQPWLTSGGGTLSTPSWDGTGTLWVADRDPGQPPVRALLGGKPAPVSVRGLPAGSQVKGLRVSADGTRIALIVSSGGGATLELGRVVRSGRPEAPSYVIDGLREVAPGLADVVSVSWADDDSLIVLGRPSGGARELQYVDTDGSAATSGASQVPLVEGMTTVSASMDPGQPLLADSGSAGVVYRLQQNTSWRALRPAGSAPTYPG